MFDRDFWTEIVQTVSRQKLRSVMTAFGVFWGLLMLMFLIGAGMGFQEGMVGQLKQMPSNTVGYFCSPTTMSFNGFESGRTWYVDQTDINSINSLYPGAIRQTVSIKYLPDQQSVLHVSHIDASDEVTVAGVSPFYSMIAPQRVLEGRYVNEFDCTERRKTCVLGINVAKTLFPEDATSVGKEIRIDGNNYEVVGVVKKTNDMVFFGPDESNSVFIPITTAQYVYNASGKSDRIFFVLDDNHPSGDYYLRFDEIMRKNHQIHPEDNSALLSLDLKSQLNQFDIMIGGINALVWLVGLGTLLAGLIGISNIMMITVKERTQEIGVLRALGAQPWTIIKQIMCESLVLTSAAGILGIIVGAWGMFLVNRMAASSDAGFFTNPYVPFAPAVAALAIMVLGGLFAGFVPARRAMAIKAIEALREE